MGTMRTRAEIEVGGWRLGVGGWGGGPGGYDVYDTIDRENRMGSFGDKTTENVQDDWRRALLLLVLLLLQDYDLQINTRVLCYAMLCRAVCCVLYANCFSSLVSPLP